MLSLLLYRGGDPVGSTAGSEPSMVFTTGGKTIPGFLYKISGKHKIVFDSEVYGSIEVGR